MVAVDSVKIQQILMNLVANAVQAIGEKGDIMLTLDEEEFPAAPGGEGPACVKITLRDTGGGMTEAVRERVFEPFFTTKARDEGTGMGLAVVHGIVAAHGGSISVVSSPGKGTAFTILLPLVEGSAGEKQKEMAELPTGDEHVLLVDDEEALVVLGKRILESLGYRVTSCVDSGEALRLFRENSDDFDILLTDQVMPSMTGADLAKEVLLLRPGFPVVLSTGFSSVISPEKAKALDIKGYVLKPFGREELARIVRATLDDGC